MVHCLGLLCRAEDAGRKEQQTEFGYPYRGDGMDVTEEEVRALKGQVA